MSRPTNNVLSFFCSLIIVFMPAICHASPIEDSENLRLVTSLKKSQRAPFKGILLSEDSAARLFADIKFSEKECKAKIREKIDILKISHTSILESLDLRLSIEKKRLEGLIAVRDDRIKFLEKNYRPAAWYESGEFWLAVGIVAGVGITATAGYAIGQIK